VPERLSMRRTVAAVAALAAAALPAGARPPTPVGIPPDRSLDPVVLTGAQFPAWSAGPEVSFREPQVPTNLDGADVHGRLPRVLRSDCRRPGANPYDPDDLGDHNCDQSSRLPVRALPGRSGVDVRRLLGYRWDGRRFVQIPFQVDERFTRYLSNNASGFAFYSGIDAYTTYAFDREGYRFTDSDPAAPCVPIPRRDPAYGGRRIVAEPDPVPGLDDNDELAFMLRDAGPRAPRGARLPSGIEGAQEVIVIDPARPDAPRFAYVMLAGPDGPAPAFDASTGYVRYVPDANARSVFVASESSYESYGAAPKGPTCQPDGTPTGRVEQRRTLDGAWVLTPRYAFRYDGRWLMTELRVSSEPRGDWTYGPDVIDRWKARAFQQDPSSETPCCGYEEEETNWGGSSILLGERAGPVRVIRETWGADSSTNNVRREVFYRDTIVWGDALRVHPIPPLDGIYVQWDYNAGRMTRYYNPERPRGVPIDGRDDEAFGNLDDPCNPRYDARAAGLDARYRDAYRGLGLCRAIPYHQSVDLPDPRHSGAGALLQWEEVAGPYGTIVSRWALREVTLGGAVHALVAAPYYRDDACFDDGTGTDPGPRRLERSSRELATYRLPGSDLDRPRRCWTPADGPPDPGFVAGAQPRDPGDPDSTLLGDEPGDERFFQGSIGTHGLHLLFVVESDNLALTLPTTEIVAEQRLFILPGDQGNVGERYGRSVEHPLAAVVRPYGA
jgi:hypothetical protein